MRSTVALCVGLLGVTQVMGADLLNMLFMADIGHPREYSDDLTAKWPMSKCSFEGAFSLYEGMYDYATRQNASPTAVMIMGDVAYGGGNITVNNHTRLAFQKYLASKVPENRIFTTVGNHDVHFLGCTHLDRGKCYFGSSTHLIWESAWEMSFDQWRSSWIQNFPGLAQNAIIPSGSGKTWQAPMRYNLNLEQASSVYLIAGLNAGVGNHNWNGDTPPEASDAGNVECEFLRDSLAHGRSLGKSVFIYMTHFFDKAACSDWKLIQQVDIWLYGHKHNAWQSISSGEIVVQEKRHYPVKMLIGNGGFDEGHISTISFGHVVEEISAEGDRVKLNFRVFDTCVSDQQCPDSRDPLTASCWRKCKNFSGGFDNGGGGRVASPTTQDLGFSYDAPLKPSKVESKAPLSGSWKLRISDGLNTGWIKVDAACPFMIQRVFHHSCVRVVDNSTNATSFSFYDSVQEQKKVRVRLAVDDEIRSPLMGFDGEPQMFFQPSTGFWDSGRLSNGEGVMRPSDGFAFEFESTSEESWRLNNVAWVPGKRGLSQVLAAVDGFSVSVSFHDAVESEDTLIVV